MKHERIIFQTNDKIYRIIEVLDECTTFKDLCGDSYSIEVNPNMDKKELRDQKMEFLNEVEREGVYGYILEKWNPNPDQGYEHIDSCYGFVGKYDENEEKFNHYILSELKGQIK